MFANYGKFQGKHFPVPREKSSHNMGRQGQFPDKDYTYCSVVWSSILVATPPMMWSFGKLTALCISIVTITTVYIRINHSECYYMHIDHHLEYRLSLP